MPARKPFLFYLVDTPSGDCWYKDSAGNILKASVKSGIDVSLKHAPDGWMNSELGFIRNMRYYAINRSYTVPQRLVYDAADIVRSLYYGGRGIEVPLTLIIFKFNAMALDGEPQYKLYYKGQLDMPKNEDLVGEAVAVNMAQGGILQLFKTFEATKFQIPCDGSIPQNIKVDFDGMLLPDVFHYQFLPIVGVFPGDTVIPTVYLGNDGDNFGVTQGNQAYEQPVGSGTTYFQHSPNNLMGSIAPIRANISGHIIVRPFSQGAPVDFALYTETSLSLPSGVSGVTRAKSLVPAGMDLLPIRNVVTVNQQTRFDFNVDMDLLANENLFINWFNQIANTGIVIVGGQFEIKFSSKAQESLAYGISAADLFELMVGELNLAASDTVQTFNYGAISKLLQKYVNLIFISGDALRASGDPNYSKFFNAIQKNPYAPNIANYSSYGPTIKISISEFFDAISPVLMAALGSESAAGYIPLYQGVNDVDVSNPTTVAIRQMDDIDLQEGWYFTWAGQNHKILSILYTGTFRRYILTVEGTLTPGFYLAQDVQFTEFSDGKEFLFMESILDVFDPVMTADGLMDLGEVRNLKVSVASDYMYSGAKIGYSPQQYDQKAGKFEWNTTAEWQAPIRTLQKMFELVSSARADPYGIERLRSNIGGTSTTRNSGDSDNFIVNIDRTKFIQDYWEAKYLSAIADINNSSNQNVRLVTNQAQQALYGQIANGSTMASRSDPSIFVFNQRLLSTSLAMSLNFDGFLLGKPANALTGLPADTCKLELYINGVVVGSWSFTSTSASTPFTQAFGLTRTWNYKDCIYLKASTSTGGTMTISNIQIIVGGTYFSASNDSPIVIDPGAPYQLVPLPNVTNQLSGGLPVISYGFQYFVFNTILINSTFDVSIALLGQIKGTAGQNLETDVYFNGLPIGSGSTPATGASTVVFTNDNYAFEQLFKIGDILFVTAGVQNANGNVYSIDIKLTSNTTKAYKLKRVLYDQISGIPQLVASDQPGAPYNIEQLRPKSMLETWGRWLKSPIFNQIPGVLAFRDLSKNQYLSTIFGDKVITENADVTVTDLGDPIFLPFYFEFEVPAPLTFMEAMTGAANKHVRFTFGGVVFYGFPMEMKQKPALNEVQAWKLLCSPKTDISNLINLQIDGLTPLLMGPNSVFSSFLNPVQTVPVAQVLGPQYHTRDMNLFRFASQLGNWIMDQNYFQPWQKNDTISLQFMANGLAPLSIWVCQCSGPIVASFAMNLVTDPSIVAPVTLWQKDIDLSALSLADGQYYLIIAAGGTLGNSYTDATPYLMTEGLDIKTDWPQTILINYRHSTNRQSTVFRQGFYPEIRVHGFFDNLMTPKYRGAFFTDQPQDIRILDAFPYEIRELWIKSQDDGVPDWMIKKISRIMLLDDTQLDGVGYSLDEGAEWEQTFTVGNPKKFWKAMIRLANNTDGFVADNGGQITDSSIIGTLDANVFGPNAGNTSQSTNPDIIEALITN